MCGMTTQEPHPMGVADLRDLRAWAEGVLEDANGWAERAEVSRGERASVTQPLDAIASRARHIVSLVDVVMSR